MRFSLNRMFCLSNVIYLAFVSAVSGFLLGVVWERSHVEAVLL